MTKDKNNDNAHMISCLPEYCIGGSINQTQNSNINVEQPNNNVVCSSDIDTTQISSSVSNKDKIEEASEYDCSNIRDKDNNKQDINQNANSIQRTKQPDSNVCDSSQASINQINNLAEVD